MADTPPPQYTLPFLSPLLSFLDVFSSPLPIPYLPIPLSLLILLHATRVSYATCQVQGYPSSSRLKKAPVPSTAKSVLLVWILLFGGWSTLAVLLAQPSPLLIPTVHLSAIVYGLVHIVSLKTGVADILVRIGETQLGGLSLDLISILVDSICRTEGITSLGVDSLSGAYLGGLSPLTLLLCPTLIGGGGPLLIGLLNLASPTGDWKLQMPPAWIRDPWQLGGIDIWSSTLVGGLYALLSGDGKGQPILNFGPPDAGRYGDGPGPLLHKDEAKLFLSVLLFALLAGNRLRKFVGAGVARAPKKNTNAKTPVATSTSRTPIVVALAAALPLLLVGLQYGLAGGDLLVNKGFTDTSSLPLSSSSVITRPKRVLLLLAHPDDEVMFFSPVLHALLSSGAGGEVETELWAACMTAGPAPDPGSAEAAVAAASPSSASSSLLNNSLSNPTLPLRARELLASYAHFPGMAPYPATVQDRVLIFSDDQLLDGMHEQWDPKRVRDVLLAGMEERFFQLRRDTGSGSGSGAEMGVGEWEGQEQEQDWTFDWLLTFDEAGISGHANHRALREAAPLVADALAARAQQAAAATTTTMADTAGEGEGGVRRPQIWVLPTLPLALKYGSLPFAVAQRAASLLFPLSRARATIASSQGSSESSATTTTSSSSSNVGTCLTFLSSPQEYLVSLAAMRDGHASQMLWFRYAWWGLSSYVFGGRICRVE